MRTIGCDIDTWDLRRFEMQDNLAKRAKIMREVRRSLDESGFIEIENAPS